MKGHRVAVWAGGGASYSWVWWTDMLEDLCWLDADLMVDPEELEAALPRARLLLLGGGDVAATRAALDLDAVEAWVRAGGSLVATCAGAYMLRDWGPVGIANAVDQVPEGAPVRAWTECEAGTVLHPVRGPVHIASEGGASLDAPLYGGPFFEEPMTPSVKVAGRYSGVARGAEWLLADRPELLSGTPAVLLVPVGRGLVVLSGPHLEHPDHPPAHLWLAGLLGMEPGEPREGAPPPDAGTDPGGEDVVRMLASIRRRSVALGGTAWRSGEKLWSGDRMAGFTDSLIPRARALARWGWAPRGRAGGLQGLLEAAHDRLARRRTVDWDEGFAALSRAGAILLDAYLAARRAGMPAPKRKVKRPPRLAPEGGFNAPSAPTAPVGGGGR